MIRFPRTTTRIAAALAVCAPTVAWAQTPSAGGVSARAKWEIDVHGGAAIASGGTGGTATALPAGEAFTTGAGFPSLRVSSWLFGDGAALFNSASALAGRSERISPLDSVLTTSSVTRRSGVTAGFRVTRALSSRFDAEFSLDYAAGGLALTGPAAAQVEKTRQSFVTAFSGLFSTSSVLFGNRAASATASLQQNAGGRLFVSGGLRMHLSNGRRHPYLAGGIAMARGAGASPRATINGSYTFTVSAAAPPFTINESDNLTIRYTSLASLLGMVGGGFDVAAWARSGIRVDARVFLGGDKVETILDAQGTPRDSDPAGAVYTFTNPAIQWSSSQQLVGRSSLSGAVSGFRTLTGTRVQTPVVVTVGCFFRF